MKSKRKNISQVFFFIVIVSGVVNTAYSMGLRTFVALPVEKEGSVVRFSLEHKEKKDMLTSHIAYGLSAKQTLLLGLPYRLSPSGNNPQGDLSLLYRQVTYQKDTVSGTNRLGLLGGAIIPTEKDRKLAVQAGLVFTHFENKNEIDMDVLYRVGMDNRPNTGRYDISWQHRILPIKRPDWGIVKELNTVLELNGRWNEGNKTTHQVTLGLQQVHKKWVIEGGVTRDINGSKNVSYLVSTRFHF